MMLRINYGEVGVITDIELVPNVDTDSEADAVALAVVCNQLLKRCEQLEKQMKTSRAIRPG